jgi:hypothetical protein
MCCALIYLYPILLVSYSYLFLSAATPTMYDTITVTETIKYRYDAPSWMTSYFMISSYTAR